MSHFLIMTSSAPPKDKRKLGNYRTVALVEAEDGVIPKMISPRARGVVRIVKHWGACNLGVTERCQFAVAMKEAEALRDRLSQKP